MKILFLSSWYPSRVSPQNGNFVHLHARAAQAVAQVRVLYAESDTSDEVVDSIDDGVPVRRIYFKKTSGLQNWWKRMRACQRYLVEKPDLVHTSVADTGSLFALWLKWRYGIRYVISEHWDVFLSRPTLKQRIVAWLLYRNAEKVLPVSKVLAEGVKKICPPARIEVLPNVVDDRVFVPGERLEDEFVFLHVSGLEAVKQPLEIIKAAYLLWEEGYRFRLKMIGSPTFENWQAQYPRVEFLPPMAPLELAAHMQTASVLVMNSRHETQGRVILEAALCNLPVLSPMVGGIPEYFSKTMGRPVTDLATSMRQALDNPMKASAREEVIKKFGWQAIENQLKHLYEER